MAQKQNTTHFIFGRDVDKTFQKLNHLKGIWDQDKIMSKIVF